MNSYITNRNGEVHFTLPPGSTVPVGKARALRALRNSYRNAVNDGRPQRITLIARPGLGKSFLAATFAETLGATATTLYGRCLPFGSAIPFFVIEQMACQARSWLTAGGDTAEIFDRLYEGRTEDRFWATRRLLHRLSRDKPVLVVFDDLQWAGPTLLELIDHIASPGLEGGRLLILCLGRPELSELKPEWTRTPEATALIRPLSARESAHLVGAMIPTGLTDAVSGSIVDASAGNALLIEQHVAAAADYPDLQVTNDVRTLLATRLDRLALSDRLLIEYASVHHDVFDPDSLTALLPDAEQPGLLNARLQHLIHQRLLTTTTHTPATGLRFTHALVREAAYATAAPEIRARGHERLARWICDRASGQPRDWDAVAGYHLEQASLVRATVSEAGARRIRENAAVLLEQAGRRALARVNYRGDCAPELLGRAVSLLPERDDRYGELLPVYVAALSEGAKPDLASGVIERGLAQAGSSGDRRLTARLQSEDAWLRFHVDASTPFSDALAEASEAVHALHDLGNGHALARALYVEGTLLFCVGRCDAALGPLEMCLELASEASDRRTEVDAIWQLAGPIYWGPMPVAVAATRCRDLRERLPHGSQPYAFMVVLDAIFLAMTGRFDEARQTAERGMAMYDDLGIAPADVGLPQYSARLSLLVGDLGTAVDGLRGACASYARRGDTGYVSSTAGLLGEALYRLDHPDEALTAAELARSTAAADDFGAQMIWRSVRAKVLARRGEHVEATSLAREAVSIGAPTDCLVKRADALYSLAEVLRLSGDRADALRTARAAKRMYDRKGEAVSASAAGKLVSELRRS
jgi:tetratricopeptide (TPR) repeat protein